MTNTNADELYSELGATYGSHLNLSEIRVAINREFSTIDHPISDNGEIVFIPPVSGG